MNPSRVVQKPCRQCGNPFRLPMCRILQTHFCSTHCGKLHREAKKKGRIKNCVVCGKEFSARPWLLKQGRGTTCSRLCMAVRSRGRKQSPESIANRLAAWRANPNKRILRGPENPKYKGGYEACYRQRLKDGRIRQGVKNYRSANPYKVLELEQNRHGLKTGRLPNGTVPTLLTLQKNRCAACKKRLQRYHIDHIMPLSRGGKHAKDNVAR